MDWLGGGICAGPVMMWPYEIRQVAKLDSAMKIKEDRNGSNDQKEVHP